MLCASFVYHDYDRENDAISAIQYMAMMGAIHELVSAAAFYR